MDSYSEVTKETKWLDPTYPLFMGSTISIMNFPAKHYLVTVLHVCTCTIPPNYRILILHVPDLYLQCVSIVYIHVHV